MPAGSMACPRRPWVFWVRICGGKRGRSRLLPRRHRAVSRETERGPVLALVARMKRSEIRKTRSDDGSRIRQCLFLPVRPGLRFASSGLRNCKGKPGEGFCGDDVETFHVKQRSRAAVYLHLSELAEPPPPRPSPASGRGGRPNPVWKAIARPLNCHLYVGAPSPANRARDYLSRLPGTDGVGVS